MLTIPPLSLYIHFPWCIRRCPYCDFNAHTLLTALPEKDYINLVLKDLEHDLEKIHGREIISILWGEGRLAYFHPRHLTIY